LSDPVEPLRLATRRSALALAQAELVAGALRAAWPGVQVELVPVVTEGDRRRDVATTALGGKGVFTAAVQDVVLDGRADLAVHSAKDLPALQTSGLVLAAVLERADPRDVLVARKPVGGLDDLPAGATVGTGSPRRVALLRFLRPDLEVTPLRGNVDTRRRKVRSGELDAVVLAAAGLVRLGLGDEVVAPLDPDSFPPAPGQGCLAVEVPEDDTRVLGLLSGISHPPSRVALRGERVFLAKLGGSCTLPAGALLSQRVEGRLEMHGFLAAPNGKGLVRERPVPPTTRRVSAPPWPPACLMPAAQRSAPWSSPAATALGAAAGPTAGISPARHASDDQMDAARWCRHLVPDGSV
jgi:hydroxymethylbilane synthase